MVFPTSTFFTNVQVFENLHICMVVNGISQESVKVIVNNIIVRQ
jgi:hypothetical protein